MSRADDRHLAGRAVQVTDSTPLDELAGHIATLLLIREKQAELKEQRDELEQLIKDHLGEHDTGTLAGKTVVTWKRHKRVALDQTALKEAEPELHAQYCTTTEVRRFEVVK